MSSVPVPEPLRRAAVSVLRSRFALFCGFVGFLICVCPNARGVDGLGILVAGGREVADGVDVMALEAATPRVGAPATAKSSFRSATPEEQRAEPATQIGDPFRLSRAAMPLLVEPRVGRSPRDGAGRIVPMTGPAVGIPVKSTPAKR